MVPQHTYYMKMYGESLALKTAYVILIYEVPQLGL